MLAIKEMGKMKNIFIVFVIVFCLLHININLIQDKSYLNVVNADTDLQPEKNTPLIDLNMPANIEIATFAMG